MVATGLIAGGTVANYANMSVTASASGGTFAFANARGIAVGAASFTGLISNTGSLYVRAITNNGSGNVFATGIVLASFGGGTIVNNSGTIYAGVSMDSGTTFYRGTAINTSWPFDAVEIDWMGSAHGTGFIYGNVLISTSDSVFVSNGKTCFNGVINQPYIAGLAGGTTTTTRAYPLTAPFLPNLDDGAGGIDPFVAGVAVGQLTVASNGTLVMVNDPAQGAAAAYVSNYTQSGSLVLEIRGTTPNGGQGGDNTVGKIVASVSANLGGSLEIVPYAGLYTDTSYAIVSAPKGGIAGTWGKPSDPSVLLDFTVSNSGTVTVDKKILNVDRIAFNAVPGLTKNEQHVGLGIEHSYSTSMTGPYADMIAKLFQVGSATEYANDLFQLSGVEYGQQALATLSSVRMLNDTVGTHLQLISSGGSDQCRAADPGPHRQRAARASARATSGCRRTVLGAMRMQARTVVRGTTTRITASLAAWISTWIRRQRLALLRAKPLASPASRMPTTTRATSMPGIWACMAVTTQILGTSKGLRPTPSMATT